MRRARRPIMKAQDEMTRAINVTMHHMKLARAHLVAIDVECERKPPDIARIQRLAILAVNELKIVSP